MSTPLYKKKYRSIYILLYNKVRERGEDAKNNCYTVTVLHLEIKSNLLDDKTTASLPLRKLAVVAPMPSRRVVSRKS